MKKVLFIVFSLILLISCEEESQVVDKHPQQGSKPDNTQYTVQWQDDKRSRVDIRIVTLTKDGKTHDYVVATNRGEGSVAIEHWEGCNCNY